MTDACGQLLWLLSVAVLHADGRQYWQHMAWEFRLGRQIQQITDKRNLNQSSTVASKPV